MTPCAAGRQIHRPADPEFETPCTRPGETVLHIGGDPDTNTPDLVIMICLHHMRVMDEWELLDDCD